MVMVNPAREQILQQGQMIDEVNPSSTLVDSEIEVLRSPTFARRLVNALRLDQDPEWNAALRSPQGLGAVKASIKAMFVPPAPPARAAQASQALLDGIASNVARNISVRRRGVSYAIDISANSQNPRRAAQMANKLVDLYLASQIEARFDASKRADSWLSQRLDELRKEVQSKERAAEDYRQAHGLSTAAGGVDGPQTADMQNTMVQARADLAEKEARLRQVRELGASGQDTDSVAGLLDSGLISQLKTQESDLKRKQAELEQRYGEMHPAVLKNAGDLEAIQNRIREEVDRISVSLQNELEIARTRLNTLQGSFGVVSGTIGQNNNAVIKYRDMLRDAAAARAVQASFLERFHEVADQGNLPSVASRLVSVATPPGSPSAPSMQSALQVALLLAIACGAGLGFLLEIFDTSMTSADDVERKIGVAPVASVPRLRKGAFHSVPPDRRDPSGYILEKPLSGFAEAFRVLRTSVLQALLDRTVSVVAVTSAVPREGKTTTSLCLARIAALSGQRVALIDCDLRRRSLNEILKLEPSKGIVEVLSGEVAWRDAMVDDPDCPFQTPIQILPVSPEAISSLDMFASPAMSRLVEELRAAYDLVILDCPPILAVAEARVLVGHADVITVVVRAEKTSAEAVTNAMKQIESARAIQCIALNFINAGGPGLHAFQDSLYYRLAEKPYYSQ
jgi:capsular exopolysaccharide synthesis family protein